jgi:amino acid transporter
MNEIANVAKTSALAVWSMVLGILSFLCFAFFAGVPAVICGHMARSKIKRSQGTVVGGGMALAGLILGYIGTVITTVAILAAIAVPNFIAYRDKATCSIVESEVMNTAAVIADYFSDPEHDTVPTIEQLALDPVYGYIPSEDVDILISGPVEQIKITATDKSGRCPKGYQYVVSMPEDVNDGWR